MPSRHSHWRTKNPGGSGGYRGLAWLGWGGFAQSLSLPPARMNRPRSSGLRRSNSARCIRGSIGAACRGAACGAAGALGLGAGAVTPCAGLGAATGFAGGFAAMAAGSVARRPFSSRANSPMGWGSAIIRAASAINAPRWRRSLAIKPPGTSCRSGGEARAKAIRVAKPRGSELTFI